MLKQIPTHLIAGPLGAGKTSLLHALLEQRPESERWAILINEFGQLGLDQALLTTDSSDGVTLSEIPGGCLCCVNGVPFQVGLTRLLRKARPDRLWIECSGLGHPVSLLQQLADPPWQGVLDLKPLVLVCEAGQLLNPDKLPPIQQQALPLAGLVIANKIDQQDTAQQQTLQQVWPDALACQQAKIDLQAIPGLQEDTATLDATDLPEPPASSAIGRIWRQDGDWECLSQLQKAPFSIGWRIPAQQQFSASALRLWLQQPFLRAKGVLNTDEGWKAINLLGNPEHDWQDTSWRTDNRLELILAEQPQASALEQGLRACLSSQ